MNKFTAKEVRESKNLAFEKICSFLDAEDVDAQFENRSGDYHSNDKFIVTWNQNWKGIPAEYGIDKTDSFYQKMSGAKAIYVTRGLFHEKQIKAYRSIERALIDVALLICSKHRKKDFWDKYVVKYNQKISLKKSTT